MFSSYNPLVLHAKILSLQIGVTKDKILNNFWPTLTK